MKQYAGYVEGTQLSKLRSKRLPVNNSSGHKGVYYDTKTGCYRARIKFKGKSISLGFYKEYTDAVRARESAENYYFKEMIDQYPEFMEQNSVLKG